MLGPGCFQCASSSIRPCIGLCLVLAVSVRVKFGTGSRDAASPKPIGPGPVFNPESGVGKEAPAFSFGKEKLGGAWLCLADASGSCGVLRY